MIQVTYSAPKGQKYFSAITINGVLFAGFCAETQWQYKSREIWSDQYFVTFEKAYEAAVNQ